MQYVDWATGRFLHGLLFNFKQPLQVSRTTANLLSDQKIFSAQIPQNVGKRRDWPSKETLIAGQLCVEVYLKFASGFNPGGVD